MEAGGGDRCVDSVFSAPASPGEQASLAEEEEVHLATRGFVVVGSHAPFSLPDGGFSFRQSGWELRGGSGGGDVNAVAEVRLVPSRREDPAAAPSQAAAAASWALVLVTSEDKEGTAAAAGKELRIPLEQSAGQGAASELCRSVIFADHGVLAGVRYSISLQIGDFQVGAGSDASKVVRFLDLSAAAAPAQAGLLALLNAEAVKGQQFAEWVVGSEHRTVPCATVWPAGVPSRDAIEAALRCGRVHADCFLGAEDGHVALIGDAEGAEEEVAAGGGGGGGATDMLSKLTRILAAATTGGTGGGGGLQLQLPAETAKVAALRDRLLLQPTTAAVAAPPPQQSTAAFLAGLLAPEALFFSLCTILAVAQCGAAMHRCGAAGHAWQLVTRNLDCALAPLLLPLLLAACLHCAGVLLRAMVACEQRWAALETAFAIWQKSTGRCVPKHSNHGPTHSNYKLILSNNGHTQLRFAPTYCWCPMFVSWPETPIRDTCQTSCYCDPLIGNGPCSRRGPLTVCPVFCALVHAGSAWPTCSTCSPCVTQQHGLSSKKMALITSDCGTMRSPSIKWPLSPRVLCPSAGRPLARELRGRLPVHRRAGGQGGAQIA